MAKLTIYLDKKSDMALLGFPLYKDQYIDSETQTHRGITVVVELGDAKDTSPNQEAFLDSNDSVKKYKVSK